MGTFILKPVNVSADNNLWAATVAFVSFPSPTDQQLVDGAANPAADGNSLDRGANGSPAVTFSCNGLGMYLDGSPTPIDTNNLPPGFNVTDCSLKFEHFGVLATDTLNGSRNGSDVIIVVGPAAGAVEDFPLGALQNTFLVNSIIGVNAVLASGGGVSLVELRIEGNYTIVSGLITLTPSGGNIESGQVIAVASDTIALAGVTFAALQDDKVIPIPFNSNNNTIEIPYPPTDPCFDCIGNCPGCEDCFTVCNEDLEGEECQACMEACLDCLIGCLDDLEDAEACQQSSQDPPSVPITIVCSGPELFGTVPLGSFTILIANASGIYQLIDGKGEDTLYSSARDGETYDVKIPNPGAKTGFFRG